MKLEGKKFKNNIISPFIKRTSTGFSSSITTLKSIPVLGEDRGVIVNHLQS